MDPITDTRLSELHPIFAIRFRQLDKLLADSQLQVRLRIVQGLRTWASQDQLFAQGRTAPGVACKHNGTIRPIGTCDQHPFGLPVTKARGGQSAHNFGYAADADPDDPNFPDWHPDWNAQDERWKIFLATAKECGFSEGALWRSFPDNPNLYLSELPEAPDDNMRNLFREGGLPAVWADWEGKLS
jgi:peptidoglycan LD-endopeptidase CwlK